MSEQKFILVGRIFHPCEAKVVARSAPQGAHYNASLTGNLEGSIKCMVLRIRVSDQHSLCFVGKHTFAFDVCGAATAVSAK